MERPRTRYAKSADLNIAYQVWGDGPFDVVVVPPFATHLELMLEPPWNGATVQRLARFARVFILDKRGVGLSDRIATAATLEERMDDVRAVMDAEGVERAALIGVSEGAAMSAMFAATYPQRVTALVLWGPVGGNPDLPAEMKEQAVVWTEGNWGNGEITAMFVRVGSEPDQQRLAQLERYSATPHMAASLVRMNLDLDVRPVLPLISAPTLVLHRTNDPIVDCDGVVQLTNLIPGARRVELPGDWHFNLMPGAEDEAFDVVEEFITGSKPTPMLQADRVLATVLFTDIVDSTRHAVEQGDHRWREVLDEHDQILRAELARHGGHEVNTTGDGFLARFDGPARAIRCAQSIVGSAAGIGVEVRAGVHAGECEVRGDDLAGIAVHIGARVAALARPSEVLISSVVRDLVAGSGIEFDDRGIHELKGVPGDWQLLAVR
ncbi:MAG: adenylate/guanylate cyclase domain-containing protein [Acidimicrobiales bacterium]